MSCSFGLLVDYAVDVAHLLVQGPVEALLLFLDLLVAGDRAQDLVRIADGLGDALGVGDLPVGDSMIVVVGDSGLVRDLYRYTVASVTGRAIATAITGDHRESRISGNAAPMRPMMRITVPGMTMNAPGLKASAIRNRIPMMISTMATVNGSMVVYRAMVLKRHRSALRDPLSFLTMRHVGGIAATTATTGVQRQSWDAGAATHMTSKNDSPRPVSISLKRSMSFMAGPSDIGYICASGRDQFFKPVIGST